MIESIQIKNFRGIREGQIEGFRKFNLLVGPNNSGKSAVLEMLYLTGTTDRPARIVDRPKQMSYEVQTSNSDFLGFHPMFRILERHNLETPTPLLPDQLAIRVQVDDPESQLEDVDISFKPISSRRLSGQPDIAALFGLKLIHDSSYTNSTDVYSDFAKRLFDESFLLAPGEKLMYSWLPSLAYYNNPSSAWSVFGAPVPTSGHTLLCDVFTTLQHLPMQFSWRINKTVPGWSQKIADYFGRVFNLTTPFAVQFWPADQEQQWAQGWIAPADKRALTIDSYGDGARSIFKTLTPLLALREIVTESEPGLFLWEEPELFQNPQTLTRLLTEVADLLKDKPIQVFIATHSLEVVANFVRLVREGHIAPNEMAAIRLNLNEGNLASSIFDHEEIQQWTEMDLDLRVPSGKVDSPLVYQFRETADATQSADLN